MRVNLSSVKGAGHNDKGTMTAFSGRFTDFRLNGHHAQEVGVFKTFHQFFIELRTFRRKSVRTFGGEFMRQVTACNHHDTLAGFIGNSRNRFA